MRLRDASLMQTWKQTATFTLRFKILTARTPELVSAEIPVGLKWCEIRQIVFGWTKQKFPFTVKSVHDLTIKEPVVTVTGKAFYDIAHAPADHSNRRHSPKKQKRILENAKQELRDVFGRA